MRFLDEWDKKDAQKKRASLPAAKKMPLQPPLLLTKSGVVMADGKGGGRIITPQAGHNTASAAPVVSAVPTAPIVPALPTKSAAQAAGSAGRTATPQKSEAQRRVDNLPNIHAFGAGNYGADKRIFGEGYNYGQGLAKAGQIGLTQIAKVGSSAGAWAENMLGAFIKEGSNGVVAPDTSKWLFNRWNQAIDAEAEGVRQKYAENTARGGRAAEIAEDMGAATVAAVPQAVAAMLTGGASSVMTAEQLAAQAAASPGIVNTISAGMRTMAKDPNFQLSFAQVFGPGYEQAKADGADDFRATVYAVGNGLMNAAVEVGGGIQTLPKELQGGTYAWKAWVDSMLDEGKEEAVQGVIERAMQNAVYDKGNPLVGIGNDAIFDPAAAAEEFAGGAVVGGILSGGQIGVNALGNRVAYDAAKRQYARDVQRNTAPEINTKAAEAVDANGTMYEQRQAAYRGDVPRLKNENGLLSLTEQEKENLSSGAKNKVVSTFQDAVQFVRNALANRASVERAYMGKVPESTARRVMQETGINIDGMGVMMNGVDVRHIIKSHGDPTLETARGQVMVTAEAIARIPEIIAQPDAVYLSETNDAKGRKAIVFEKRFGDTYITVQGVSNGKNLLQTDTLYIQKGKTRTSRYSMLDVQENAAPEINAQSAPPQGPSYIDTSIPQGTQGVNAQDMRNGVKYAELPRLVDANGMDAQQRTAWLGALEQMPQAQRNQFETAAQIAKRFGAAVQAQTMQEGVQGSYQNGVIYIDPAAVDPVRQVLIHELTHHMETSGLYGKFSDAALRFVAEDMGADVDALRRTVIEDYAKAGVALDEDGATRELVAKFAEEKLFTDEATVRRMLAQDRNLFQRIYDWLRDTAAKLTGTPEQRRLIDAQNLYEKALRQAEAGTQDSGTQYDIRKFEDGRRYVQADRQVIFGNDPESWSVQLEDYINGKIRRGQDVQLIAEDGDVLTLTKDSAGKLADNHTGDGRTMSESAFERKVNAAAHIDELAQISMRGKKNTPDYNARHGAMAADGWNYRTAYFRDFDGRYYMVTISTALNPEGTIIYNVGHMKEEAFPKIKGSYAENGNGPRGNASTDSIPISGGNVNTEKEFTTGGNGHLNTTGPNAANGELFTTDILRNALNVKSRQLSTGRSIEEMAGVDTGRTVQENGLYRRDAGDAASEDAISWRDVYGVSDRVAPPDMTMKPVSAQDAAEQNAYMERLARDENIIGDDPYTVSDAIYDAQLRRLEGQEAPPERTVEQTTQADLDDLVRLYADQADPIGSREDRIKATESMVTDHTVEEKKSAREKARETWSYLYRKMVDAGHSVSKVSEAVNDPYLYQFYNQARASTSAGVSMIADAQTNVNAQKVGESLNGIFSPIRQKGEDYYHAFQMYLFDLHNIDRMSLSQNKEQAVLDARAALRDFDAEHPEVRTDTEGQLRRMTEDLDPDIAEMAKERLRLLRAVDRADAIKDKPVFGVDVTAEVSRERARRALQEHPEFERYREQVRRYIDNLMQYRVDSGLMTQENADFLKKFYPNYVPTLRVTDGNTGAGRDRNAVRIGKTVGRAQGGTEQLMPLHEALSKQTMKVVREGSKNRFGQRILQDYVNAGDSPAVRRYIKDAQQFDGGDFDPDTLNDVGRQTFTKEKTFTVFQDGKLWELTVDDTLFDALKALSPDAAESNTLTKTIRASNNLFKSLVTGYNPTFLVRNTVRDLQTAGLYTRDGKAFLKNYPKALAEIKNNGEYWQMYKALGGSYSSVFDYATGTVKEPTGKAGKLLARLEALNMATEQAPRLAEFMSVVEKGGVNSETLADALCAAADVTVNFGRAGTLGKVLNANYVPFLNPGIQGFDKMIRRVTETKGGREWAKLVGRAVVLGIAPTLLNALLYHDDEEWDDLRDSDKDTNYMFKLKDGIWLKLPKGRELSILGITADRLTDAVKGEDVDILATLNTMGNQVAPANPLTSNIASALVDSQLLNPESPGRTWYGGDIENQRLQSYAPGQRYDSSTDVFSKAVGGALGISPKKLNYVLDQYTGVVGDFLLPALTPQAERGMFAKAFTTDVVSNNRVSGDFFDEADQLMYAKNGGDETAAVVSRFWSKQQSACSDLWKEIREVEASKLSDKEKRQKTRELKAVVTGIQKNALAVEETYRAVAEKFLGRGLEPEDAYREANRECFGAEYALQTYNKDVYQRAISAKSNGVSYEDFYTYYFGTKGIKATGEKSAVTQKFEWLRSSGMSVTAQAEIYFADMASDTTLKQLAELESNDVITPEQFYQYKVATSGLTKKAEKLEAINMLELTNYQKDALYYLNGWAQSTIGQAPWVQGVSTEAAANRLAIAVIDRESQPEQTPQWQQSLEDYLGTYEQRRQAAVAYIRGKQALESEDDDIYAQRRKAAVAYIRGRKATSEQGDIYEQRRQAAVAYIREKKG